VQWPLDWTL